VFEVTKPLGVNGLCVSRSPLSQKAQIKLIFVQKRDSHDGATQCAVMALALLSSYSIVVIFCFDTSLTAQ